MENVIEDEKKSLKSRISRYCEERGISKADFAVKSSVSGATLSAVEKEQWGKISAAMVYKLRSALERDNAGLIYDTTDYDAVMRLCDSARENRLMIGLIGDTGTGKTTALKAYGRNRNVYRIAFEKSMNPRQFFAAMLKEMGVGYEGSVNAMMNRAADELNHKESPLLVVDEAGKMTRPVMLHLHDLREKTSGNCGVVLAGMPYFRTNLQKDACKGKEGCSEFLRRINIWHELGGLSPSEAKYIAESSGIKSKEKIRELSRRRRFGDLVNDMLLIKILGEGM